MFRHTDLGSLELGQLLLGAEEPFDGLDVFLALKPRERV